MAVIWRVSRAGNLYEVRQAGKSIRLYTNGVFHSQYRDESILNGGVWDILWLPLFFRPVESVQRVLMLGLGAGAAAAKILRFFPSATLTAIDIDQQHIAIARKFAGLRGSRCTLCHADAIEWLEGYTGEPFDVIVDDLYGHRDGEPVRAVDLLAGNRRWLKMLKSQLRPGGLLLVNSLAADELTALRAKRRGASAGFKHAVSMQRAGYDNVVVAYSDQLLNRSCYREQLQSAGNALIGAGPLREMRHIRLKRHY